jgi:UPF0755 protein
MSRTPSTHPHDEPLDDTPPHGVPPVSRAAVAYRLPGRDDVAPDDVPGSPDGTIGDGHSDGHVDGDSDGDADGHVDGDSDGHADGGSDGHDEREGREGSDDRDGGAARDSALAAGDGSAGPVRVTRRHAGRARPQARVYESRSGRHLHLTRRGRVVGAVLAVVAVVAGVLAWYEVEANPFGKPGKPVLVDVHPGESLGAITATLSGDGVIGTTIAFHVWSLVHGSPVVRPGTYQLHRNLTFSAAKAALDAGPNVARITVVPGTTFSEITSELSSLPGDLAGAFSHAGSASGVHSPFQTSPGAPLEGLIGSGTYRILPGESGKSLLSQMVARFDTEARAAGLTPATSIGGLDAYQLVTLASIAQKEGYYTRYMGDVARVIFNRLAGGMHLDMTSTVLYSLGKDGGQVTPQEEQLTTPYNTYLHAGLTPTPICTPSVQALRAAVDPPAGTWLYFDLVTAHNGIMKFASTYTQQQALVQEATANAAKASSTSSSGSSPGSTT